MEARCIHTDTLARKLNPDLPRCHIAGSWYLQVSVNARTGCLGKVILSHSRLKPMDSPEGHDLASF